MIDTVKTEPDGAVAVTGYDVVHLALERAVAGVMDDIAVRARRV